MSERNADLRMTEAAQRYRNWALAASGLVGVAAFVAAAPQSKKRDGGPMIGTNSGLAAASPHPPRLPSGAVSTRRAFEARADPRSPSLAAIAPPPMYHLVRSGDWSIVDGQYQPASFAAEGFIHLSTAAQLDATAHRYYSGMTDLLVVEVDHSAVADRLMWEPAPPPRQNEFYPHVYGPLNESAVRSVAPYRWPAEPPTT